MNQKRPAWFWFFSPLKQCFLWKKCWRGGKNLLMWSLANRDLSLPSLLLELFELPDCFWVLGTAGVRKPY